MITDVGLERWFGTFRWLGFTSLDLVIALNAVYEHSLFGRRNAGGHVRSGRPQQWRGEIPDRVLAYFENAFPDAPRRLGYARSDSPMDRTASGEA
jgi:hypothetical protein